jgi:hypothetical protein
LRTLAKAIVEHDAGEGCDRAGDRFPDGGIVAKPRFEDDGGAGLADHFNMRPVAADGDERVAGALSVLTFPYDGEPQAVGHENKLARSVCSNWFAVSAFWLTGRLSADRRRAWPRRGGAGWTMRAWSRVSPG